MVYGCNMMQGLSGTYGWSSMLFMWLIGLATLSLIGALSYWIIKSANKK